MSISIFCNYIHNYIYLLYLHIHIYIYIYLSIAFHSHTHAYILVYKQDTPSVLRLLWMISLQHGSPAAALKHRFVYWSIDFHFFVETVNSVRVLSGLVMFSYLLWWSGNFKYAILELGEEGCYSNPKSLQMRFCVHFSHSGLLVLAAKTQGILGPLLVAK